MYSRIIDVTPLSPRRISASLSPPGSATPATRSTTSHSNTAKPPCVYCKQYGHVRTECIKLTKCNENIINNSAKSDLYLSKLLSTLQDVRDQVERRKEYSDASWRRSVTFRVGDHVLLAVHALCLHYTKECPERNL